MADPYDFENDDYEESSTPNFEPSFMRIFGESDEEEFTGFIPEEDAVPHPEHTHVATFHNRTDEEGYT